MWQAVYTALKETESRSTDILPLWKVPLLAGLVPRQQKAQAAVDLIRKTTTELIDKCKAMVDAEEQVPSPFLACAAIFISSYEQTPTKIVLCLHGSCGIRMLGPEPAASLALSCFLAHQEGAPHPPSLPLPFPQITSRLAPKLTPCRHLSRRGT